MSGHEARRSFDVRAMRFGWSLMLLACKKMAPITADPVDSAAVAVAAFDAGSVSDSGAVADSAADAGSDACVPGEEWEATVRVRKTWHATLRMNVEGPLELVVPRAGIKNIYPDCAITGGGCGDCAKPYQPGQISCDLSQAHAKIDIGVDDTGPVFVDVVQRGDVIYADWTYDMGAMGTSKKSDVLMKLPCAVKIRFVRKLTAP